MAQAAERGELAPTIIALGIATILLGWTIYGLSAAGYPPKLPLTRTALVAISTVLLLRAMAVFLPILWEGSQTATFMIWSSAIVGVLGITFAIGTWLAWGSLSGRTGG